MRKLAVERDKEYILSKSVYMENNNSIGYVHQKIGIDAIRHEEMVLKLVKESDNGVRKRGSF